MIMQRHELATRLGPLTYTDTGPRTAPSLLFLAGAMANADLWRDVVELLDRDYRCVAVDLPLGAHPRPLTPGVDRSARSLARLILDVVVALDLDAPTIVANDTAGGLCLLALDETHPGLDRVSRLVLTNCDNYQHFPPKALQGFATLSRRAPALARGLLRATLRTPRGQGRLAASVAHRLDAERQASFFGPLREQPRVIGDLVAAMAGFSPSILTNAAPALRRFPRSVLLVWGLDCDFFPLEHARRLAADFPAAEVVSVPGAKTWVPVDQPRALAQAIRASRRPPTANGPERLLAEPGSNRSGPLAGPLFGSLPTHERFPS